MSDEPIPELPADKLSIQVITFTRPSIVLSQSEDGQDMHLRNGASIQVELQIEESYGYEVVDEKVFRVVATSRRVFGGNAIDALDELSEPTAVAYLALVGTRVLHGFRCHENKNLSQKHGKPVYKTWRAFLVLP